MSKPLEIENATTASVLAPTQANDVYPAKRRVVCDGVKGVLAYSNGRWCLENDAELALLEALGGSTHGVGRLRGITAALNSPAAGAEDVTNLNRCLRSITETEPVWAAGVYYDLKAATAVACAYWDHPKAIQWLCWALSALYSDNLTEVSSVGTGWNSFQGKGRKSRLCGHRRDTGWMSWVGDDFWGRLATHESSAVREFAEAIDPSTSPERLGQLWASPHDEVLDVIASRPDVSESLLHNAASGKLDRISYSNIFLNFRIAQNQALSAEDIHELAGESYGYLTHAVSHALINHPNGNAKTLDKAANASCRTAVAWVASHPNTQASTLKRILAEHPIVEGDDDNGCSNDVPTWKIWAAAVANPAMPTESLTELAQSPLYKVRAAVAKNPNATVSDLEKLARDRRLEVRAGTATNPTTPAPLLEQLALDKCVDVRKHVPDNPEAPSGLLAQLALDPHISVRRKLAWNDCTPGMVLDMLASDSDDWTRNLVARNQSAPKSALVQLAGDSDEAVRSWLGRNPSTPSEVLAQLANDSEMWVRMSTASHPSTPASALRRLASDASYQVRISVAGNRSSPIDLLEALASDPENVVKSAVAANPSTPIWALEQLAEENCPVILEKLAANPSTPEGVLERLSRTEWAGVFHPALDALANRKQVEK